MWQKLTHLEEKFDEVERRMTDPAVLSNPQKLEELGRRHAELAPVVKLVREHRKLEQELRDLEEVEKDREMAEMVREERKAARDRLGAIEGSLREKLIPKDPDDEKNAIIEIRAGTGGEEAALFAGDMVRMYGRYAERMGWKTEEISSNPTGLGGFKEIILSVRGKGAYGMLKFEGGVHRVQRVPETEASGRIHTSAVSVAVLPEAEEIDFEIEENDLRIDVFRSSGPGGQSVNTTDSAVRITHVPTGEVVSCQDEKSQHKNRAKAMKVLRSRLLERVKAEQHQARDEMRRSLVKRGDRSDRVRTYNFPQSRITDHRIDFTTHNLPVVLEGELDELVGALRRADRLQKMEAEPAGEAKKA
jgi:peptide chain release factor 1